MIGRHGNSRRPAGARRPKVRWLGDNGPSGAIEREIAECAELSEDRSADAVGIAVWESASRTEIAWLDRAREEHEGPILVVLTHEPTVLGARLTMARADGAVMAADLSEALGPTLAALIVGQCVMPQLVRRLAARPSLSPRERQILAMVVMDLSNAEIARKLYLTESSVKSHLTSAFGKLGVSSRSDAAELILDEENGLGAGILRITPAER